MNDIDKKDLALRVAGLMDQYAAGTAFYLDLEVDDARACASFLREAVEGWKDIASAPKDGTRFLATHIKSGVVCVTWFGKTSHVPLYGWCEGEDPEGTDL